jgi:hypothetical protein
VLGAAHPGRSWFARPGAASRVLRIPPGKPLTRHRAEQFGAYRDGPGAVVGSGRSAGRGGPACSRIASYGETAIEDAFMRCESRPLTTPEGPSGTS